jgi:hypothetical protein
LQISAPNRASTRQRRKKIKKKVPKKSRISRCNLRVEAAAVERLFFFFFFSSFSTKTLPAAALNAEKELLMLGPRHFTATTLCTAF